MHHNLVPNFPPGDFRSHGPNDARRVRSRDVVGLLVAIKRADRHAQCGPNAVIVNSGRHYQDQDIVVVQFWYIQNLLQHGPIWLAMTLLTNGPAVHLLRDMTQGRHFAHVIEVFFLRDVSGQE